MEHSARQMPQRPRSHEVEDLSRNRLRYAFNGVGGTVEDLRKDYAEDLLISKLPKTNQCRAELSTGLGSVQQTLRT
jgi:hypothetical protein